MADDIRIQYNPCPTQEASHALLTIETYNMIFAALRVRPYVEVHDLMKRLETMSLTVQLSSVDQTEQNSRIGDQ